MLKIGTLELESRLLLGTAQYPSPQTLIEAITVSQTQLITVSLRRQNIKTKQNGFWDLLKEANCHFLPNTAGCYSAKEAVTTAQLARELFNTNLIKLEVIGDEYTLQPNSFELIKAADVLIKDGFEVLPYCTDDIIAAQKLVDCGCRVLMPWAAPIGSGRGIINPYALELFRERFKDYTVIIDAGLGKPSHANQALEMGFDAVLLNTAVALANNPVKMAQAFAHAVTSGRFGYEAGLMQQRNMAQASTPLIGKMEHIPS
ncbi:MAG: thiazole synthase [Coxiella sp. (in: Bacteria)]|nr:MAG: thiazole synthase [Coxiella sp. (in: g-proteobacteria)]